MAPQPVVVALGLGMAVREAARAGLNRVLPGGGPVPLRVEGVTDAWLGRALRLKSGDVTSVRVVGADSGTAARARIAVTSESGGVPERLFVKLVPTNYLQHVMLNLFELGVREIHAYTALGDVPPVRVPRCHVAMVDPARGRSVLVLEDLSETARFRTVLDSLTRQEAEAVADGMADLHAAFWESDRFAGDLRPLAGRSAGAERLGNLIRRRFLGSITGPAAGLIPEEMKRECRMLFERSGEIDAFWDAQPRTLIHGDPHLGNLFFEGAVPGFLDWQVAMAGAGIRDVAYFACASVEPELLRTFERELVERYTARLAAAGVAVEVERQWTLYQAATTEFYLAAVCTAEAGERMQPRDVMLSGVERAVAGVAAHDGFGVLARLLEAER
ncbi:phosphotransferase [Actinocorallia longicatena]|uniref:Phosphotransferase n=1 Tax=Actinocorallia longicatena TaxID=111803 RepID=A0ABP6QFI0_9ACTN